MRVNIQLTISELEKAIYDGLYYSDMSNSDRKGITEEIIDSILEANNKRAGDGERK